MSRTETRKAPALAIIGTILAAAFLLAGCEDNFARRDTVAPWAGDDVAANEAIETINPWPKSAFDQQQITRGSKVEDAMKVYRLPPAAPSAAPTTTDAASSAPSPAAGSSSTSGN